MKLYIVRHGDASAAGSGGERPLTELGLEKAAAAGQLLAAEQPQRVLYSPKLRTRQTAEAIVTACGGIASVEEESLLPPSSAYDVCAAVEESGADNIVLVSHMPLVAELVAWFTRGESRSESRDYALPGFPPAGVVALDMNYTGAAEAELEWYAFPPAYGKVT